MNDSLNTFIQQNRHAFDAAMPGAHGWVGVEKVLNRLRHSDSLEEYLLLQRIMFDTEQAPDNVWAGIESHLNNCKSENALERFICDHREAFDTEIPDLRVWSEVAASLPDDKPKARVISIGWHRHLLRAAASVALLVIGLSAGIWYAGNNQSEAMSMADVSQEYAELQKYYEQDITSKKEKLAVFAGSRSADVMQDLDQLDRVMEELQQELANVPPANRQQVVRAMIENYKAKAAILERVLEYLDNSQTPGRNKLNNEVKNM